MNSHGNQWRQGWDPGLLIPNGVIFLFLTNTLPLKAWS